MQAKRIVRILLLPVLAFIFAVGWVLYAFGSRATAPKKQAKRRVKDEVALPKADGVEIGMMETPPEEETTIEDKKP